MRLFVFGSNVAFMIAGAVIGLRLLLLARRTRQLPETLLGLSLFVGGAITIPLWWIGVSGAVTGSSLLLVDVVRATGTATSGALITLAVWRVFYPLREGAAFVAGVLLTVMSLNVVVEFERLHMPLVDSYAWWASSLAQMIPYAWMAFESLRQVQSLIRRRRLGLHRKDEALIARLFLWAIAMAAIVLLYVAVMLSEGLSDFIGPTVVAALGVGFGGLTCALCLSLAFFTPRALLRRFARAPDEGP